MQPPVPVTSVLDHHDYDIGTVEGRCAESLRGLPVRWATSIRPDRSTALVGGRREHRVVVSPGALRVTYGTTAGFERDKLDPAEIARLTSELTRLQGKLDVIEFRDPWYESYEIQDHLIRRIEAVRTALGLVTGAPGRGRCGEWSRKSRARMTRRLATLDVTPMAATTEVTPAMVTLTYPGDYLTVCPTGEVAKAHLKAFRSAWERKYGQAPAIWKLERQRRGAPHFHLWMLVHHAHDRRSIDQRHWARMTWARIVGATGPDRAKHERAGVSIDIAEGSRYTDPQRIAVYFSKHNAPGASDKSYQNEAPDGWLDPADGGGVGRFWGYWRLKPIEVEAVVSGDDAVAVTRLLRSWVKAQKRTRRQTVRRVSTVKGSVRTLDRLTGEIGSVRGSVRQRNVTRRFEVRALSGCKPAGFVLANDAPGLATQISRALWDPADWPPGQRRPLP